MLFLNTHTHTHLSKYVKKDLYIYIYIKKIYTYMKKNLYTRPIYAVSQHTCTHTHPQPVEQICQYGPKCTYIHIYIYIWICINVCMERDLCTKPIDALSEHTYASTYLSIMCRKRTAASSKSRVICSSPPNMSKETSVYLYIYKYVCMYISGKRSIHEAYWCCFLTHTHTHTHTPEHSV